MEIKINYYPFLQKNNTYRCLTLTASPCLPIATAALEGPNFCWRDTHRGLFCRSQEGRDIWKSKNRRNNSNSKRQTRVIWYFLYLEMYGRFVWMNDWCANAIKQEKSEWSEMTIMKRYLLQVEWNNSIYKYNSEWNAQ